MTKFLTTGQMIDTLKVGEIAETEEGYKVIRNKNQSIVYINKDPKCGQFLAMDLTTHRLKWTILPNYVSFDEAMNALKEGKNLKFYFSQLHVDRDIPIYLNKDVYLASINFTQLFNGKWMTEGEPND